MKKLGSIEAGGTKFVLAVGDEKYNILKSIQIPTTSPEETIKKTIAFFKENQVEAIGIGSFGPIDINHKSPTYGSITTTPKKGWAHFDLLGQLKKELHVPMSFTTDVNASAYGEMILTGEKSLVYFTIGTGIGGGAVQEGQFIGGFSHTEMGHQFVKRHPKDVDFVGICPFHKDCLEGLASGPSIEARTGIRGENLPESHPVWEIQAYYIAQAAVNTTLNFAPEKIVFGGGVMAKPGMLELVKSEFEKLLNGYVDLPGQVNDYLVLPVANNNGSATIGDFASALSKLK
ncbi:fructokinase ScrK [Lactococcus fujiensis]|uniref:Fructokinase n=1 Tax=Lactococcus fujiensis JCM 16395 TaxID=1291764 RepID=A0A2A5RIW5_9LACT|nr:fructokinase ScrK [Lactococcus fujiensis]PCR99057.1 fructokinase [Lactococcus fujiensis JCM 16395]